MCDYWKSLFFIFLLLFGIIVPPPSSFSNLVEFNVIYNSEFMGDASYPVFNMDIDILKDGSLFNTITTNALGVASIAGISPSSTWEYTIDLVTSTFTDNDLNAIIVSGELVSLAVPLIDIHSMHYIGENGDQSVADRDLVVSVEQFIDGTWVEVDSGVTSGTGRFDTSVIYGEVRFNEHAAITVSQATATPPDGYLDAVFYNE